MRATVIAAVISSIVAAVMLRLAIADGFTILIAPIILLDALFVSTVYLLSRVLSGPH